MEKVAHFPKVKQHAQSHTGNCWREDLKPGLSCSLLLCYSAIIAKWIEEKKETLHTYQGLPEVPLWVCEWIP